MKPLLTRIFEKTIVSDGCWLWVGARNNKGYATVFSPIENRKVVAHRALYELVIEPVPAGLQLDHLCKIKRCVNPWHLEVVTGSENVRRDIGNRGIRNREKTHCRHGHPFDDTNTRWERTSSGWRRRCVICRRTQQQARRTSK